jgi:NADH pyrophosphatase NudC (nudix superfamily)
MGNNTATIRADRTAPGSTGKPSGRRVHSLQEVMSMPPVKYCPQCASPLADREIEGKARPACGSCSYVHWNNPVPVVAALVERGGEVVLARNKAWPEGMFGLITGFLEKGERPEAAVLREVREELGIEGTVAGLIGVYAFFEMNQVIIAYHVDAGGDIVLGDEIAEILAVPPERIKPWPFGTGYAVSDWLKGRK